MCLPVQEMQVQSLSQEDPLEKEIATHSSILPWEIPGAEKPGGLQSTGSQESDMTKELNYHHEYELRTNHQGLMKHLLWAP